MLDQFWLWSMQSGLKNAYECVRAFSETDFTEDLELGTAGRKGSRRRPPSAPASIPGSAEPTLPSATDAVISVC
jgi:hypothetical protein